MKKIILIAIASMSVMTAHAAPNQNCIDNVQSAVKKAVSLFSAIDQKTINVHYLRSKPAALSVMEEEPASPGYKVYTTVSFKYKKKPVTETWLSESGVVFDGDAICSVLYSNLDIAN